MFLIKNCFKIYWLYFYSKKQALKTEIQYFAVKLTENRAKL